MIRSGVIFRREAVRPNESMTASYFPTLDSVLGLGPNSSIGTT